jgi:hypothetical protein
MISIVGLRKQLEKLDGLYNVSISDPELPKYYSRLAVLELSGWIEEEIDDLVRYCPQKALIVSGSDFDFVNSVINKNSGFDYKENLRKMMKQTVGVITLNRIEAKLDPVLKLSLESALTILRSERNDHAHKPISSANKFTAPSICLSRLEDVFRGFEEFERILKKLKEPEFES